MGAPDADLSQDAAKDTIELWRLMNGTLTGTPEKFVAIFPQALSIDGGGPQWNCGPMGREVATMGLDDVGFAAQCVSRVNEMLVARFSGDRPVRALGADEPVNFYGRGENGVLVIGLGAGGQMAYRYVAERPRLTAAGTTKPLAASTIGVVGATAAGISYSDDSGRPFQGTGEEAWTPSAPVNVVHIHGQQDLTVLYQGQVGDMSIEVNAKMGSVDEANRARVYRFDVQPGPDPDNLATSSALDPWAPTDWVLTESVPGDHWIFDASPSKKKPIYGGSLPGSSSPTSAPTISVQYVLRQSLGHTWPTGSSFSAMSWIWDFFVTHPR